MKIAVCDDNALFLHDILEQLQQIPIISNIALFSNLDSFLFTVDEGICYDAVLMDIDWARAGSGMSAAEELYRLSPDTKIIYVTGYSDRFSQRIFLSKSNLSGFLTKPVDADLLTANIEKAAGMISAQNHPAIAVKQRGTIVTIHVRDIHFIESRGHTVTVHTDEGLVKAYERLATILPTLPKSFFQCHKSYIVNMDRIRRFEAKAILLKSGSSVPVSRAKYSKTKEAYLNYIGKSF